MRTILITGGSRGLGKAMAAHFAKDNAVIIMSVQGERLKAAAQELGCDYEPADVGDCASVEQAMTRVNERHPVIDVLINCAGAYDKGKIDEIDPQEAGRVFAVNALGPLHMAKAVAGGMKQRGRGIIININSMGGLSGKSERTVYHGSKWALTGITKSLQLELAPFGVRVTGIYPGALEHSMQVDGESAARAGGIAYADVVDAVEYVLTRSDSAAIPEIQIENASK